jgi:hypothetical protein
MVIADREYETSKKVTASLTELIKLYGAARTPYADCCIGTMIGAGNV